MVFFQVFVVEKWELKITPTTDSISFIWTEKMWDWKIFQKNDQDYKFVKRPKIKIRILIKIDEEWGYKRKV